MRCNFEFIIARLDYCASAGGTTTLVNVTFPGQQLPSWLLRVDRESGSGMTEEFVTIRPTDMQDRKKVRQRK